jgi:hypothetical protein
MELNWPRSVAAGPHRMNLPNSITLSRYDQPLFGISNLQIVKEIKIRINRK